MTKEELARIADQLETSLVRATDAKKDIDLIVVLRALSAMAKDGIKSMEKDGVDYWKTGAYIHGETSICPCCKEEYWYWMKQFSFCPNCGKRLKMKRAEVKLWGPREEEKNDGK